MFQVRGLFCDGDELVLILYELTLVGEETVTWALVCFVCCIILLMRSNCSRVRPSPSRFMPSLRVMVGELAAITEPLDGEGAMETDPETDPEPDPDPEPEPAEESEELADEAVEEAFEEVEVVGDSSVTPVLMGRFMALICSSDRAIPVAASTTELPVEM